MDEFYTDSCPQLKVYAKADVDKCIGELERENAELERELAEALGEIKRLRRLVNDCHIVAGQLETERNEARAEIERLKEELRIEITENLQHIGTIRWYEEMEIPKKNELIKQLLDAVIFACHSVHGQRRCDRKCSDKCIFHRAISAAERGK